MNTNKKISVLTIAGSDSGAGAGIQSDLKTFRNHGLYGLTVVTAVTSQNTFGVQGSYELPSEVVYSQLQSVFLDFNIKAAKTGMLSSEKVISKIVKFLKERNPQDQQFKLVVDPVIVSKNGFRLLTKEGIEALKSGLLPLAYLLTPNLYEAEIISRRKINNTGDLEAAAKIIYSFGCKNVLIKGGHFPGSFGLDKGTDVLYDGKKFSVFKSKYLNTRHTHGIGCSFSAAITANIALGKPLKESIVLSKAYIIGSLSKSQKIGKDFSPVEQ